MTVVLDACRRDTMKLTVIPTFYVGIANPPSTILSSALNTTSPTTLLIITKTILSTTNTTMTAQSLEKIPPTPKSHSTQLKDYGKYYKSRERRNLQMENLGTTQKEWWRASTKLLTPKVLIKLIPPGGDKFWSWRNVRKTCIFLNTYLFLTLKSCENQVEHVMWPPRREVYFPKNQIR